MSLDRHAADDLFGLTLVAAIEAGTLVLTGPTAPGLLPDDAYERLARDTRANGAVVIADLSGPALRSALAGGIDVLKVSAEELVRDGLARDDGEAELLGAGRRLTSRARQR